MAYLPNGTPEWDPAEARSTIRDLPPVPVVRGLRFEPRRAPPGWPANRRDAATAPRWSTPMMSQSFSVDVPGHPPAGSGPKAAGPGPLDRLAGATDEPKYRKGRNGP